MKIHRGNFESNKEFLEKTKLLDKNKKILEIGSGNGYLVRYLLDQGYDITGTEIGDDYINFAKTNLSVDLSKIDGEKLNFEDQTFDIVLSFDVLEHIPNTDKHLQEVKRILKPGGFYLFGTPNKITNIPFEIIKEKSFSKYKKYHCSLYTYHGLTKKLEQNYFEPEFIKIPVVNSFFKNKIKKYIGHLGLFIIKILNPDILPNQLKTNFYVVAKKNSYEKKILIDGRCFIREGSSISVYLYNLLKHITEDNRFLFVILINNKNYLPILKKLPNLEIIISGVKNNIIWDNFIVPFFAIKTKSEIIFFPKSSSCWFKIPKKNIITTIHGMIYKLEPQNHPFYVNLYWKFVGKMANIFSDTIIVVSNKDKEDLLNADFDLQKIKVIPIGINSFFQQSWHPSLEDKILYKYLLNRDKYVIQVGHLTKKKNQLFTLQILNKFLNTHRDFKLVFVGDFKKDPEYYKEILQTVKKYRLEKQVVFTGVINQNEELGTLPILVKNAKIGLFPSTYEGFGIPPLEIISAGTPVLISDRGSLKEIYGEGNTLRLENKNNWIYEIEQLVFNESYNNFVLQKQSKILERYKWENIAVDYVNLFLKNNL